jgi:hypothetical protein
MALGAFLAGLLLAETEFALQVESDIAPYRGLLLGLFFMTVSALYISGVILFLHLVTEEVQGKRKACADERGSSANGSKPDTGEFPMA